MEKDSSDNFAKFRRSHSSVSINYFLNIKNLPDELRDGIKQLANEYPISFKKDLNTIEVCFSKDPELDKNHGLKVCRTTEKITVKYGRKIDAFRALGRIFGERSVANKKSDFVEYSQFDMRGVMIDCSRNGVMTVDTVKAFLRRFALMGLNTLLLYTEDTYEVPGEPFFGYLRGRYTYNELKELDEYAYNLGIEMFPCIQVLGHLGQVLQWKEFYKDVTDTSDILLVGEKKTYELLEKMISSISAPFKSKRIHIGMDEAHALGTGKYKKLHGERRRFDIMNEHLTRVCEICNHLGLKPMIWSDMYFRIGSVTGDYYDLNVKIPKDVIDNIPKEVELVYWDYYHTDSDFYAKFIDLHRYLLGKEPIVACGLWNWARFWTALPFAYSTIEPCMHACRDKKIRQVLITAWGDDGMENDIYSILPAVQFFAELSYKDSVDMKLLKDNFHGSCKADIDSYKLASQLDSLPCLEDYRYNMNNASKWLLWDDPLIGLCEPLQEGQSFRKHYMRLSEKLKMRIGKDDVSKRLHFPAQISKVLAIKCDCRKNLVKAYRNKNKKELANLLKQEVKPLLREVRKLWRIHRDMWLSTYKVFGLEVIEIRYGGLISRLQTLMHRVQQYLNGDIKNIPEFETRLIKFEKGSAKHLHYIDTYRRIATPSAIF